MSIFGTPSKGKNGYPTLSNPLSASSVNTSLGDLIVVAVSWNSNGVNTSSPLVDDSAGNTYLAGAVTGTPANYLIQFFYCLSATAASATNVVSWHNTGLSLFVDAIYVWSFPISGGTAAFDVGATSGTTGSTLTPTTASYSTTGSDEVVCGLANMGFNSSGAAQVSPAYTLDNGAFMAGNALFCTEHIIFSSPQTGITTMFTLGAGNSEEIITIIAFKASSAAGGPPNALTLMGCGN